MAIGDYSTTRDSNASIAPGDIRSNDYRRDQQLINSIRQLMADLAAFINAPAFDGTIVANNATSLVRNVDNSNLNIFGGTAGLGANVELYGSTHATQANNAFYDAAAHTFRSVAGALIPVTSAGIAFPATQVASGNANTLDDYEENDWTPTLTFATPGDLSVAYDIRVGRYIKIGKLVTLTGRLRTTTFTHTTASGNLQITGLPFAAATLSGMEWICAVDYQGITHTAGRTDMIANLASAASIVQFVGIGSAVNRDAIDVPNTTSGTQILLAFNLTYEAAA